MEINLFANRFQKIVKRNSLENEFQFYLFGSFIKKHQFVDIDVLIIYSDHKKLNLLKNIIYGEFFDNLIHLTCLTEREEAEFDFINGTSARLLSLYSTNDN